MEAFAAPIKPGKEPAWKAFTGELTGSRKVEFDDMNRRLGLTTHAAWLQRAPDGSSMAVVVVDGPGSQDLDFLGKLASSDQGFDSWFRSHVEDIHPMDLSAPPPPPERFL